MTFDFDWRAACMDAERRFMDMKNDRDRYRALAEYLCQNAPSVVVPDEIACLFPDPLVVRGDSTN